MSNTCLTVVNIEKVIKSLYSLSKFFENIENHEIWFTRYIFAQEHRK